MEKILDIISRKMEQAFADAGFDAAYGRVTVSNRPDLCQYQCNGALSAAKVYKCAPIAIANAVAEKLAKKYDLPIIDLYTVAVENEKLHAPDGVHFTPEGYEKMARYILDTIS